MYAFDVETDREYAVFSVSSPARYATMEQFFASIGWRFKPLLGMYQGKCEMSFIAQREAVEALAEQTLVLDDQESILVLGPMGPKGRDAWLTFHVGGTSPARLPQYLGTFASAHPASLAGRDAWTYDPVERTFYVTHAH